MKTLLVTLLFCGSALSAAEVPNVTIEGIDAIGSGCPAGSWTGGLSSDRQHLNFELDDLTVEFGPSVPMVMNRRNCQVTLRLRPEAGWQYSIRQSQAIGYMELSRGVQATHRTVARFDGQASTDLANITTVGPFKNDYDLRSKVDPTQQVWSDCSDHRPLILNIGHALRAVNSTTPPHARGLIDNDSLNLGMLYHFEVEWRVCGHDSDRSRGLH